MQQVTLVVFCKRPLPGQGKQRIAATMGTEAAYDVARALLCCAMEDAEIWLGPVVLSPVRESDRSWAENLLHREHLVIPQVEGNLGQKLNDVDQQLRRQGHERLLFIGTDAPEHSPELYHELHQLFQRQDVVLTPAADGGVTTMGSCGAWPNLAELPWSTERLGDALADSCRDAGFQVAFSSACYDVDNREDLHRLLSSLVKDTRPARQQLLKTIQRLLV